MDGYLLEILYTMDLIGIIYVQDVQDGGDYIVVFVGIMGVFIHRTVKPLSR
jgi:roadblock/LC7 domain-containing protein